MSTRTNEAKWIESRSHWRIDVQKDGVRKTFYSSIPGRKGKIECHKKADEWLDNNVISDTTRVSTLLLEWFEHQKKTTSKTAWRQYQNYVNNHFIPRIGLKKISNLKEHDFQDIIDELASKGYAKKTLMNIRGAASSFLKWCRKRGYTQERCEDIVIPTVAKRSQKGVLGVDDYKKVMTCEMTQYKRAVVKDHFIYAYRFALVTGLRPGELIALQWANVDFETKQVSVQGAINDANEHTLGKNENARRTIALGAVAEEILLNQRKLLNGINMLSPYVFPAQDGSHVTQETFRAYWYRFLKYNNIPKITPYELRHTFVSANKNLPEGLVRDVIGHSKDMDTFGTYGHLFADESKQIATHMDKNVKRILEYKP